MKVVSIGGIPIGSPGEPDPRVIEDLERWLAMAKTGQLSGVALVGEEFDGSTRTCLSGVASQNLVGDMFKLMYQITRETLDA